MYDWLSIDIAASGMAAQRLRMNAIASNLANINTTQTPAGGPYKPLQILMTSSPPGRFQDIFAQAMEASGLGETLSRGDRDILEEHFRGVVAKVIESEQEPILRKEPGHPHADENGIVAYPDISLIQQMTNLMAAARMYEANMATIKTTKEMIEGSLRALQ